ncbi:MAG: 16S rRNA (cytosine(1402)-N(4))-methyltransferase RsmH [Candidatus Hydrogenedentes bacterium]|nr:16S rRNA (cytosine(1402)-N(4))-methyltransferase RsmH [Candidatus Hydrogenedentota bacterium]
MHTPVLAGPALEWLGIREDGTYVDCTAGAGGHAELIAQRLSGGRLIALDRDSAAVDAARARLARFTNVTVLHRNYAELAEALASAGIDKVDGILLDAGLSSVQLDDPLRGFSFQQEGPLDMRMDTSHGPSAADLLAAADVRSLAQILKDYGDVGPARRIAARIIDRRDAGRLASTCDLAEAVSDALAFVRGTPDEVRTVFQAIRMAVNEELRWLRSGLEQAIDALAHQGRLVVIAFHSGEDRVVKNVFRDAARPSRELLPDGRVKQVIAPRLTVLTPKPVRPGDEEVRANPRSKSACLRAAERRREEGSA